LQSPYDLNPSDNELTYEFTTSAGSTYIAYFTEFYLLDKDHTEIQIFSFGTDDGMSRNRRIIFGQWFNEVRNDYTKYDSPIKYAEDQFYSSLIIKNDNPQKEYLIEAFQFTIDYWMGN